MSFIMHNLCTVYEARPQNFVPIFARTWWAECAVGSIASRM